MASEFGRIVWEGRPKDTNNGHEELLVFGYSCKLFRDNEKAQYVDKGEHLIPWMGDSSLMVDRSVCSALFRKKNSILIFSALCDNLLSFVKRDLNGIGGRDFSSGLIVTGDLQNEWAY